jgi:plastocyanin
MDSTTRNRIRLTAGLALTTILGLAFTGMALAGSSCHRSQTAGKTTTVALDAMCFTPTIAYVEPGATVEFVNDDTLAHNVVGHGVGWGRVEHLKPQQSLTVAFEEAGVYPYTCTIHPGMVGAIVVGGLGDVAESVVPAEANDQGASSGTIGLLMTAPLALIAIWRWKHRIGERNAD